MEIYVGILSNRGRILQGRVRALAYAFEACGIEPAEDWAAVDSGFADMLLEWFFSGDWVLCEDEEQACGWTAV